MNKLSDLGQVRFGGPENEDKSTFLIGLNERMI